MISRYTLLQILFAVVITSLNVYGLSESLKYNSWKGFVLAIASLVALLFCLQILQEMKRIASMEEDLVE